MTDSEFEDLSKKIRDIKFGYLEGYYLNADLIEKFIEYASMGKRLEEKGHYLYALEGLKCSK